MRDVGGLLIDGILPCIIFFLLLKLLLSIISIRKPPHDNGSCREMLRKYSEGYLQYGFTPIIAVEIEKLSCVICCGILSAESMKLNKLKCHVDSKHLSFAGKDNCLRSRTGCWRQVPRTKRSSHYIFIFRF